MASIITTVGSNQINSTNAVLNASAGNYVQYNFTSIPGVSKVGKYIGTGAAGNYVDCGFKPSWVMVKNLTSGSSSWAVWDSTRGESGILNPNSSAAETVSDIIDFTDDGFVWTGTGVSTNELNSEFLFLAFAETSSDANKSWADYEYATTQDTLSIAQDTLLSFANGFSASGQSDTQESVGAGVTYTLGAGHENKHYWLYKDKGGNYGVTEYRPLEGTSRNTADKWGVQSPLDASLRTTAKHFDYESETGVCLENQTPSAGSVVGLFDKTENDITTGVRYNVTSNVIIQYKFNEKRILKSWRMRESGDTTETPEDFTIEGSNDGLNWTAIDSTYTSGGYNAAASNGASLWGSLQDTSANTTAYQYIRLNMTANNGDAGFTYLTQLEFNTILPSDYYLIDEGVMYDSTDTPIERIYLAELYTNDDGEVSNYTNLPVAKQRFTSVEVQDDLKVHGEIANRGVCTAWVSFSGTDNPPLIKDSYNVKDVVDIGAGSYNIIFEEPMDNTGYSVAMSGAPFNRPEGNYTTTSLGVYARNTSGTLADYSKVLVQVFGGKSIT